MSRLDPIHWRRGVFGSVIEVQVAIKRFIAESNGDPKPFTWTADQGRIVQAATRQHQVLDLNQSIASRPLRRRRPSPLPIRAGAQ